MKVLIFGGTTEGRILAERLTALGHEVTVSVATSLGAEEMEGMPCHINIGRLGASEMAELAGGYGYVIDATHPYAAEASANIRTACRTAGIPLKRVTRGPSAADGCRMVGSCREAAAYLKDRTGNILITTGSKNLADFSGLDVSRLYPRVLPTKEALDVCEKMGIPHRNILALQGPFSVEFNIAVLRQYRIRYLVSKDGGRAGGFPEKKEAAVRAGAELILVGRPADPEGIPPEQFLREWEEETR